MKNIITVSILNIYKSREMKVRERAIYSIYSRYLHKTKESIFHTFTYANLIRIRTYILF